MGNDQTKNSRTVYKVRCRKKKAKITRKEEALEKDINVLQKLLDSNSRGDQIKKVASKEMEERKEEKKKRLNWKK